MSENERETAGAVRSAHVAHFIPADWAAVAERVAGALERADRSIPALQVLVIVPDGTSANALGRQLQAMPAAAGLRVLPVSNAARGARMLRDTPTQALVASPAVLADLLKASALKLDEVQSIVFAAADEYADADEALSLVLADTPKTGSRVLTAAEPTPAVETLIERYLHKARRMGLTALTAAANPDVPATALYARVVTPDAPLAPLSELLDELDPPSTVIVAEDERTRVAVRTVLDALGYAADSTLVSISDGAVPTSVALAVMVGVPSTAALQAAITAHPVRIVALVTSRQRDALTRLAGVTVIPLERTRAVRDARSHEETLRGLLRGALASGYPAHEVLALEPMLAEFDGLAIAGAALRLYEKEKARADGFAAARPVPRDAGGDSRPSRDAGRDSRPPRESRPERSDRGDRGDRGDRDERPRPPREDRPFRSAERAPREERPFRTDRAPREERPFRTGSSARPSDRGPRRDDDRPPARGSDRPPARGGDRPPVRGGDRPPFRSGPGGPSRSSDASARPSRPFTRGPRRDDDRPRGRDK